MDKLTIGFIVLAWLAVLGIYQLTQIIDYVFDMVF